MNLSLTLSLAFIVLITTDIVVGMLRYKEQVRTNKYLESEQDK